MKTFRDKMRLRFFSIASLLFFFIVVNSFVFAQQREQNLQVYRGDKTTINFRIKENLTVFKLYFAVKQERLDSLDRLIDRKNLLAGGDSSQVYVSYDSTYSTVLITLRKIDTWDLPKGKYVYDLEGVSAADSNLSKTFFTGTLTIKSDVRTPWDGTDLPDSGRVWFILSEGNADQDFAIYDASEGRWLPISVDSVISLLSIESGATPDSVIFPYETNAWDKDASDDVTITGTQDITGEKTFSNSKTVFSGDSVIVDGYIYSFGNGGSSSDGLAYGKLALGNTTASGLRNLANGNSALRNLISGDENIAIGNQTLYSDTYGYNNIAIGNGALYYAVETGFGQYSNNNVAIGFLAGQTYGVSEPLTSVSNSIFIGSFAKPLGNGQTNQIVIGSTSGNGSNTVTIGTTSITDTYLRGKLHLYGLYSFPVADGTAGYVIKTDGNGQLYFDAGTEPPPETDSLFKVNGQTFASAFSGSTIEGWLGGINSWSTGLSSSSDVLRLGKTGRQIYFNNGAYSDFWLLHYNILPYNLPYAAQISHEFRTDYYNDTLKTIAHLNNLAYLDGTGTPMWHPDGFGYTHNLNQLGVGDLPDSNGVDWNWAAITGVKFTIDEVNKTPGAKRFPLPVRGFEFRLGDGSDYTYPYVYSYYSNLDDYNDNEIEQGWHFYGKGDFPSYFGGDIISAGDVTGNNIRLFIDSVYRSNDTIYFVQEDGSKLFFVDATGGSPVWGSISGTLSSQTDLQNALNSKQAADADLTTYAGITPSANVQSYLGAANYAAMRTLLGLGTVYQYNVGFGANNIPQLSGTPGTPDGTKFLRDDGTWQAPAGGGNVSKVGTPANNQVGVWTGDGTIEGDADFTFDGNNLAVTGTITGSNTLSPVADNDVVQSTDGGTSWNVVTSDKQLDQLDESYQPLDADLTTYAGITPSANIQTFLGSADYSAMRTNLSLVVGTNVQAYDADLTTYAGITPSANVQSILGGVNYAAIRALLDLEAGTDFYSVSGANAAFQPLETTLTDIADGTINENLVNTANPWADNEVANNITNTIPVKTTATSYTIGTTDARELYGGVIYVTGAATITIPAVTAGASFTVITIGAVAVSVDPNASDLIILDGTTLSDGDKATNTSTSGDIIVFTYYDATGWYAASGSNDGDLWTDGN